MQIITLGTSHGDPTVDRYNAATLYHTDGGKNYLVDAGAPAAASMIRNGMNPGDIENIFLTHLHEDHFGGLFSFVKHDIKYQRHCSIWLPEFAAARVMKNFFELSHRRDVQNLIAYQEITEGNFFDDGNMKLKAVRTRHFANENIDAPSFAFILHCDGKRILHTGDLCQNFSDFPWQECERGTILVLELTHYQLAPWIERLAALPLERLIFTHIGNFYSSTTGEGGAAQVKTLAAQADYPCSIASDGEVFQL